MENDGTYGFDPIPETEWSYVGLCPARQERLSQQIAFEDLTSKIVAGASVRFCKIIPFGHAVTPDEKKARQVVYRISLDPPNLCDQFFNGRDGLRARYWRGPTLGDDATRHIIEALLPKLVAYPCKKADVETIDMDERDICVSLRRPSAKIWPIEEDSGNKQLEVRRWNDNPHPNWGDCWRWTPEGVDLEVKGALIGLDHVEYIPSCKLDRAQQIWRHGFT